jgi:hypothetical protein
MILRFNEYKNFNKKTLDFIDNKITESDFINYLNIEVLNENIITDILSNFKQKVIDIFWSFLIKSYEVGFAIFDKINTFVKWLLSKINSFAEKHPTLWRIIIITSVTLIILIVSASSAHAQTNNQPIPLGKINMAIGWLDSIKDGKDPMLVNKAITHLIDLRDGHMDINNLGDGAIKMADAALSTANKIIAESKTSTDSNFFKFCTDLIQKGSQFINATYTKSGGFENVRLAIK